MSQTSSEHSTGRPHKARAKDRVAITLAVGLACAINLVTLAVLYDAVLNDDAGLSENATQLLTTAFGGIIGVLGSYVGYKVASQQRSDDVDESRHDLSA